MSASGMWVIMSGNTLAVTRCYPTKIQAERWITRFNRQADAEGRSHLVWTDIVRLQRTSVSKMDIAS